jgi:hypothetical protein
MSKIPTVKIKDPKHPNGEIVVNADDPRAKAKMTRRKKDGKDSITN